MKDKNSIWNSDTGGILQGGQMSEERNLSTVTANMYPSLNLL